MWNPVKHASTPPVPRRDEGSAETHRNLRAQPPRYEPKYRTRDQSGPVGAGMPPSLLAFSHAAMGSEQTRGKVESGAPRWRAGSLCPQSSIPYRASNSPTITGVRAGSLTFSFRSIRGNVPICKNMHWIDLLTIRELRLVGTEEIRSTEGSTLYSMAVRWFLISHKKVGAALPVGPRTRNRQSWGTPWADGTNFRHKLAKCLGLEIGVAGMQPVCSSLQGLLMSQQPLDHGVPSQLFRAS